MSIPQSTLQYEPQIGSLSERVLNWFALNPEEELSSADIARKFDVAASGNVSPSLAAAVSHEILKRERGVYVVGPHFHAWQQNRSQPDKTAYAVRAVRPRRTPAPHFDPEQIAVQSGVVMPQAGPIVRADSLVKRLHRVFERMQPETHVEMPIVYLHTAGDALTKWRKTHKDQQWSLRKNPESIVINRHA